MFLQKIHQRQGSLSFRLSIWYVVIFFLTSILALSIFYYRISTVTMANIDNQLIEELHDFIAVADTGDHDRLITEFDHEVLEEAGNNVFFRLISPDGGILRSSGRLPNPGEVSQHILASIHEKDSYAIETIDIPGHQFSVRTIYGAIAPAILFNMGMSLEDNYAYLHVFRNLLFLLIIPIFLVAAFIGWFLARHALQGVEEVTQTAMKISNGSIDKRVAVRSRFYEIASLTNTFNGMLDRIASLIRGMREMNDNIAHDLRSPLARIRGIAEMTLLANRSIDD